MNLEVEIKHQDKNWQKDNPLEVLSECKNVLVMKDYKQTDLATVEETIKVATEV